MLDLKKIENEVRYFWKENNIIDKIEKKNNKGKGYFLLDGPPYANFIPHVGHIKNTVFKDLLLRIANMKGHKILFKPGFDTHGLPVENMVEKKLNLKSKKDIEKFGIDKFMIECKNSATLNKSLWMKAYEKLGSLYSNKDPYITYENYYINSAWWAFSEMYKKGLVYEGEKPVMWCPRCETSLAGYEITDSYKDVTDPGVYVLFKLKDSDEYLLVYTTTPWTLPANVAIAISPKEEYIVAEVLGKKIIIAEKRLQKLSGMGFCYNVINKIKGKELVGKKYEPLLNVPLQKELSEGKYGNAHEVIASISLLKERVASKMRTKKGVEGKDVYEEFVTVEDGTGMVHTAPGHGKTDFLVGEYYGLARVSPVNDKGELTKNSGFKDFVKDADKEIIKILENEGKLLFKENIRHSYPLCWRCKSPLIFRLSKQLFFRVEKVKKSILKANKKVSWYPEFAEERFINWVENAEDWNISRQRYWGIPIPIWKSEDGEEIVIANSKELEESIGKKINDFHTVEKLIIKRNGKIYKKVKGILDVWFDSGVAPWASIGYPYNNKILFENNFPVSRINEAQDQIRGWFYSLMFCSAALFEKPAFSSVSMTGWVLDMNGNKMSKSLNNVVTAESALDDLGSDILRYYFCWDVAPYDTQKFNSEIARKEIGRILNVLWNLQNLINNENLKIRDIEDKWIISRLESVTKTFDDCINNFEFNIALRKLSDFILKDLSRSYVQISREKNKGNIILHSLKRILVLLAPISLFITERIWQNLKEKGFVKEKSVHLCDWPKFDTKKIDDELEEQFEFVFELIEKGLAERDKEKIGLKWPLKSADITSKYSVKKELKEIIKNQLNVKEIYFDKVSKLDSLSVKLDTKMTPELEAEGFAREFSRQVQATRKKSGLHKSQLIDLKVSTNYKLTKTLSKKVEFIKKRTNSENIEFTDDIKNSISKFTIRGNDIDIEFS